MDDDVFRCSLLAIHAAVHTRSPVPGLVFMTDRHRAYQGRPDRVRRVAVAIIQRREQKTTTQQKRSGWRFRPRSRAHWRGHRRRRVLPITRVPTARLPSSTTNRYAGNVVFRFQGTGIALRGNNARRFNAIALAPSPTVRHDRATGVDHAPLPNI